MSNWHDPDDPMFPFFLDEFIFNDDKKRRQRNDTKEPDYGSHDKRPYQESDDYDSDVMIERNPVKSNNIASVGYDDESEILEVELTNGSVYRYYDVPGKIYDGLMRAGSRGSYLHSEIITQGYQCERIVEGTSPPRAYNPVNTIQPSQQMPKSFEKLPVGIPPALFNAIKNGKLDVVRTLLKNNPNWITTKDQDGKTPLHYAVELDNIVILQHLIKCGAEVDAKNDDGFPDRYKCGNGQHNFNAGNLTHKEKRP